MPKDSRPPFDIDSRSVVLEVDSDTFVLSVILDALPSMCGIVHDDEILRFLLRLMERRTDQLFRHNSRDEIEDLIVCGYGKKE